MSSSLLELPTVTSPPLSPLLRSKITDSLYVGHLSQHEYPKPFLDKVNEWVDKYLELEDIATACRLSSIFNQKSQDLLLLLFLIGELLIYSLKKNLNNLFVFSLQT